MYDMARDLNGQLSSRIIVFEQLVGESQRQIEQLETLLAEAEQTTESHASPSRESCYIRTHDSERRATLNQKPRAASTHQVCG